jgi:hypothetical protein
MSIVPPGLVLPYFMGFPALRFAACRAKYNRASGAWLTRQDRDPFWGHRPLPDRLERRWWSLGFSPERYR